jgi:hypothetical protein
MHRMPSVAYVFRMAASHVPLTAQRIFFNGSVQIFQYQLVLLA